MQVFGQVLTKINISETSGFQRSGEYINIPVQLSMEGIAQPSISLIVESQDDGKKIPCQISEYRELNDHQHIFLRIFFPVNIEAYESKNYLLKVSNQLKQTETDLDIFGEGLDLVIENKYFRVDLSKDETVEPKSYDSGQIRELLIKGKEDQLLTNVEDRLHWAPNFKRPEIKWYTTIAHWNKPEIYQINKGPYRIQTVRKDYAPDHPEILLTAKYEFYSNAPYFRFYSEMEMVKDLWLELLRNDEMTMDSMFTHVAFKRPSGDIVDVTFSERKELLERHPIENESPWICFYNIEKGFAFGSIRLCYENTNQFGHLSPMFQPHTQIGEWLGGIKYWNRRLIHDHLTFVPKGSRYIEENAYLVFKIGKNNRFETINYWRDRLNNPLEVKVYDKNLLHN
jgi:hypothetical protein